MKVSSLLLKTVGLGCLLTNWLGAGTWLNGVVDGAMGGKFSSLKFDSFGNAHVAYFDPERSMVGYSFWDHTLNRWFSTSVDSGSGFCSLALDSKQYPHIAYPEGSGRVKHAYWDGSAWQKQAIDIHARVINYYTSITLDAKDNPSISFYEEGGTDDIFRRLRVVSWEGTQWAVRTVDADHGSGKFNSMAIDSANRVQIAYGNVDSMSLSLRYGRWNGKSWETEVLERAEGAAVWSVAMLLDKNDIPHIVYTDVANRVVKYATRKNGNWVRTAVDSVATVAYPDRNGIALDTQGIPYISYYDAGLGVLKVAHQHDGKWLVEVVDQNFAGFTSSLQIDHGWIWVTYSNTEGNQLQVARRRLDPAVPVGRVSQDGK